MAENILRYSVRAIANILQATLSGGADRKFEKRIYGMFRDYILNEVEKLALVIARLIGLKADGKTDEFIHLADSTLLNEYNIPLEELLGLTIEGFKLRLEKENYSADKLDALAQLLYLQCEPFSVNPEILLMLKKVLIIFDILEQKYHRQSFENINKRKFIYQFVSRNYE